MEQIFFDFKLNFNLFDPNTKKTTSIYAVVYLSANSIKLILGLKFIQVNGIKKGKWL